MKLIVVLMLVAIVASLFSALVYLARDQGKSGNVVRALTVRIGLSIALFIMLFVFYALGWIRPHGLMTG